MEKNWLFVIGLVIVIILTIIGFFGISTITGNVIYEQCWELERPIEKESELAINMQGCSVNKATQTVCCPFNTCPDIAEISCS